MAETIHFALSADLVGSRKARNRVALAARIQETLGQLARTHAEDWFAPLTSAKGLDELSGVLRRPGPAFEVATTLNRAIWPARFRFGLGAGTLDLAPVGGPSTAMDGPAFHRAAEAIRRAQKDGLPFAVDLPGRSPASAGLLEAAALLHGTIMLSWTPTQSKILTRYLALGHQGRVAEELGISQQWVSESLDKAKRKKLESAEDAIRTWLEEGEA